MVNIGQAFRAHWIFNARSSDVCQLSPMSHWKVSQGDMFLLTETINGK